MLQRAIWTYRKTHSNCIDFWKWTTWRIRRSSCDQDTDYPPIMFAPHGVCACVWGGGFSACVSLLPVSVCAGMCVCSSPESMMDNVFGQDAERNDPSSSHTHTHTQAGRRNNRGHHTMTTARWGENDG